MQGQTLYIYNPLCCVTVFFSAVQGDGINYFCLIVRLFLFCYCILLGIIAMAQINLNEGLFSNLAVVGRFLDIDHLTSMCVQLPKQETVKTAESKITTVIYLKHTLELVEPLRLALKDTEAELFKAYYEVLDVLNNWQ